MVAKISIGSSLYGALSYNGEKINKEEGRVLCTNKIYVPPDGKIGISEMVDDFKNYMPKTGRTKKPVLHISLNPHPDDVLSDSDLANIAREYLDKLGFGEQPYIVYKHTDIDRHHIHIVTVNVDEQGKRLNMDFIHRRSKKATTEIEEKYNLRKAERQRMDPDTPLRKVDYNAGDVKRQVANTVKLIMSRYSFQTMGEYNSVLSLYGLTSEETNGRVNGREYHGIVYSVLDENGRKIGNPFKASRLGKFASLNAVHEKINRSEQNITRETVAKTRRRVAQAMDESHNKEDFIAALKERNIDLVLRYTDEERIYGATFIDHDTHTVLNGSRLGREFAANALNERFSGDNEVIHTPESTNTDNQTTQSQAQQSLTNSAATQPHQDSGNDYDNILPGLDLFQLSPTVDADEEDFKRRMKRKKKRGQRPKF